MYVIFFLVPLSLSLLQQDNLKATITIQETEHNNALAILNAQKESIESQLTSTLTEYKVSITFACNKK